MKTEEMDKLTKSKKFLGHVREFMEFCNEQGIHLFDSEDMDTSKGTEEMIYKFLDIDPKELEKERSALLASLQS